MKRGAPGRIRTRDPLLRRQLLCPAELRAPADNCAWQKSHEGHVKIAVCRVATADLPGVDPAANCTRAGKQMPAPRRYGSMVAI